MNENHRSRRLIGWILVIVFGGGCFVWFALSEPTCPLLVEVTNVRTVGHRYHVIVSINNPTDDAVAILREEEGFADVFLTKADGLPLMSQQIGTRPPYLSGGHSEWASVPPNSSESAEIIFHVVEAEQSVFAEMVWNPDLGFCEKAAQGLNSSLPQTVATTRIGKWLSDRCLRIGAPILTRGEPFTPSLATVSQENSQLRIEAAKFVERETPVEFSDAPERISFEAIDSYAKYEFESLDSSRRIAIEKDAFELYERYEKSFSREAVTYSEDLHKLVRSICQEVEFRHPQR